MTKEIAVIGLGQFGGSAVKQLHKLSADVTVIDISESKVKYYEDYAVECMSAAPLMRICLKPIGIEHYDEVIIAIGENIQTSILCTLILKELGVESITAKAQSNHHGKLLKKSAQTHVHPETEMGIRLANQLVNMSLVDYMEISDDTAIVEYDANERFINSALINIGIREKFGLNVIAIKRNKEVITAGSQMNILENDVLVIIGKIKNLNRFESKMIKPKVIITKDCPGCTSAPGTVFYLQSGFMSWIYLL